MSDAVAITALCKCDKGSSVNELVAIQSPRVKVCGKQIATIGDFAFAALFGTCSALGGKPCVFAPDGCWSVQVEGILIGSLPPLVRGAKLSCVKSGTITVVSSATIKVDCGNNHGLPASVPTGTNDYYRLRYLDFVRRHPCMTPPSYYLDFGDKYLRRMMALAPSLSPPGRAVVMRIRDLLQEALEERRREDPGGFDRMEVDGQALEDFARETHVKVYRESGIYDLRLVGGNGPVGDKLRIIGAIGLNELIGHGRKQFLDGMRDQVIDEVRERPRELLEAVKEGAEAGLEGARSVLPDIP